MPAPGNTESISCEADIKAISTFDFSTLNTELPHFDLIRVSNNMIDLAFKGT